MSTDPTQGEERDVYVVTCAECGGAVFICVARRAQEHAREMGNLLKEGFLIDRITTAAARSAHLGHREDCQGGAT